MKTMPTRSSRWRGDGNQVAVHRSRGSGSIRCTQSGDWYAYCGSGIFRWPDDDVKYVKCSDEHGIIDDPQGVLKINE
jgi:hypothetical protein